MTEETFRISIRQAAALLSARLGRRVTSGRLERVVPVLVDLGHISPFRAANGVDWEFTPLDVDVLAGELLRRRGPWARRALRDRGFRAWVDFPEEVSLVCLLPWWTDKGVWGVVDARRRPETVEAVEWPTGRITGVLVASGRIRDDLPVYVWRQKVDEVAVSVEKVVTEEGWIELSIAR